MNRENASVSSAVHGRRDPEHGELGAAGAWRDTR
jgi:hypothetical protein